MAFEKLRTIVITAIIPVEIRSKIAETTPTSRKRFEDAKLIPSENEVSRAGPLLASIRYGSPDNS
jgi:hypothetical protein